MLIMNMIVIFNIVRWGKDFEFVITTAGCVTWYNSTTRVAYEDGTDDYFAQGDIDGVEIVGY